MQNFRKMLGSLFLVLERVKGKSRIVEVKITRQQQRGQLTAKNFAGYEINVYCSCKHLRRVYDSPFFTDKDYILYRVSSVVSYDAPEVIRRACELDMEMPALLPQWMPDEMQKMVAISAYLDLVIDRIVKEIYPT